MSVKPQQVSAASASEVNPKIAPLFDANWLELWYQPKIDSQTLSVNGAEALVRIRHPYLGTVPPESFLPEDDDPRLHALSQFVIDRAIADWHSLFAGGRHIDISINLPISFLRDPACLGYLCRALPDHPAFTGMIVQVNGSEIVRTRVRTGYRQANEISQGRHFRRRSRGRMAGPRRAGRLPVR